MFANRPSKKPRKLSKNQRTALELIASAPSVDGSGCVRSFWKDSSVKVRTVMSLISGGLVKTDTKKKFLGGSPRQTVYLRLYRVTAAGRKALKGEA